METLKISSNKFLYFFCHFITTFTTRYTFCYTWRDLDRKINICGKNCFYKSLSTIIHTFLCLSGRKRQMLCFIFSFNLLRLKCLMFWMITDSSSWTCATVQEAMLPSVSHWRTMLRWTLRRLRYFHSCLFWYLCFIKCSRETAVFIWFPEKQHTTRGEGKNINVYFSILIIFTFW